MFHESHWTIRFRSRIRVPTCSCPSDNAFGAPQQDSDSDFLSFRGNPLVERRLDKYPHIFMLPSGPTWAIVDGTGTGITKRHLMVEINLSIPPSLPGNAALRQRSKLEQCSHEECKALRRQTLR